MKNNKGKIIVISAPSGAGKSTIVQNVLARFPDLVFSVSATTRRKRSGEIEGVHYFFLDKNDFEEKIKNGAFLEWEQFYGYYYGTFRDFVENNINSGKNVLLELDVKGALSVKKIYPDSALIYIEPPNLDELIKRLKNRKTESEEDLKKRIQRAEMELSMKDNFDYLVTNENLDVAISQVLSIVEKIINKENI
ncbi:MAG: guanylate kinase [Ignavibacteriaceae bacterium]